MRDDSIVVIVGGIPGVGKTTIINKILNLAKEDGFALKAIVFGTVMMDIAREIHGIENRDQLRTLKPSIQREIQKKAAKKIAEHAVENVFIVDTHYSIKTSSGAYLQGIPKWVSDNLHPKLVVLIETMPEEILSRRNSDNSRDRDSDDLFVLADHQAINKAIAVTVCQNVGGLLSIIENRNGQADKAALQLYNQIRNLKEE